MAEASVYTLAEPTKWASPPETYSYSRLGSIRSCPRRWLLLTSEWGQMPRFPQRASAAAIEGQIVHDALDRLAKEVGRAGRPPIGSLAFSQAVERCGFWHFFHDEVAGRNSELASHPRTGPRYVLRRNPVDLANQAIRLFREQYRAGNDDGSAGTVGAEDGSRKPLEGAGFASAVLAGASLTEVRLRHPGLPFVGVIDLVRPGPDGGATIVDFKTGEPKAEHLEQVEDYAVLWWRATRHVPSAVVVQYLHGKREWHLDLERLERCEEALRNEIRQAADAIGRPPGPARPSGGCTSCPVRARCDEGWEFCERTDAAQRAGSVDLELRVVSEPTATGYLTRRPHGKEVSVVFEAPIGTRLPEVQVGDRIRLLDALAASGSSEVEVKQWTEAFRLARR